jgi:protocatechuate 3,4-dioxygenase beta subunit
VWRQNTGQSAISIQLPPATQPIRLDLPFPSPVSLVTATGRIHIHGTIPADLPLMWLGANAWSEGEDDTRADVDVEMGTSGRGPRRIASRETTYTISAPPGTYRIIFRSAHIKPLTLNNIHLPGQLPDVTIEMAQQLHLSGSVTDAANGKPITQFAVRVRRIDTQNGGYVQDDQWTQVGDSKGHFDVVCIDSGTYSAQVSTAGYAWLWSPQVTVDEINPVQNLSMQLTRGGSLAGTVLDPAGNPVAGAKVIPLSMAMSLEWGHAGDFENEAGAVVTDSAGHFLLPLLQSGEEALKIVRSDFSPLIVPDLNVVDGASTSVPAITLLQGGSIDGIVYDSYGKPLPNVAVQLENSKDGGLPRDTAGRIASAVTDEAGHYHIDHLATQVMWVILDDLGERQGVVRRVVRPLDGKTAHLDFGGPNPIRGRLIDADKPVAHCDLRLSAGSQFGDVVTLASTDSDGTFTFYGPPPGKYSLYAETPQNNSRDRFLRDVEVSDRPLDLGGIQYDCGDVIIKLAYDDPAMASRHFAWVGSGFATFIAQPFSVRATEEGDHLRAVGIPPGHFVVTDDIGNVFAAPFDRQPGDTQTTVVLHIPKATARLKLIDTSPAKDTAKPHFLLVRNQEGTIQIGVGPSDEGHPIPPGVYRILDPFLREPRGDCPPIALRAGETTEIKEDLSRLEVTGGVGAAISVWTADGVLDISSIIGLIDDSGKTIKPAGIDNFATVFVGPAGHYRAEITRPGQPAVPRDIDLPPSASPRPLQRLVPVYLVVP